MNLRMIEERLGMGLSRKRFTLATASMAAGFALLVITAGLRFLVYPDKEFPLAADLMAIAGFIAIVASVFPLFLFGSVEQKAKSLTACMFAVLITFPMFCMYAAFTFDITP